MNVELHAEKREVIGKKVKVLRKNGKIPAIVYGPGVESPVAITLDAREASKALRGISPSTIVTITVDGDEMETLVREIKYQIVRSGLLHVDFLALVKGEAVRTMVSIELFGESDAVVTHGALLNTGLTELEIEAKPKDLPDVITVDISTLLNISDAVFVRDLELPNGVEAISESDAMVVFASAPAAIVEEEEEEEDELADFSAEPEVIEKGKTEEEDEE